MHCMKNLFTLAALLLCISLSAQTLTLTAGMAEVAGTAKTQLYPLNDLYFIYNSSTGGFEARTVEGRLVVYAANISTVTISGASTAAQKITYIENTHVRANTGVYQVFVPRNGVAVRYRSGDKRVDLLGRFSDGVNPLWYGHIDSVKTASTDTTSALRLTALRLAVRSGQTSLLVGNNTKAATIAAGAAAGASPTLSITGNGLSGEITINTGSTTTTTGVIATITLPVAFPNGCRVALTPSSDVAAAGITRVFVTTTASTFVLNASGTALTASTNGYKYFYTVTGF